MAAASTSVVAQIGDDVRRFMMIIVIIIFILFLVLLLLLLCIEEASERIWGGKKWQWYGSPHSFIFAQHLYQVCIHNSNSVSLCETTSNE